MLRLTLRINRRTIYNIEATRTECKTVEKNGVLVGIATYDCVETVNQMAFTHKGHIIQDGPLILADILLSRVRERMDRLK